jgi:hypothetical protein
MAWDGPASRIRQTPPPAALPRPTSGARPPSRVRRARRARRARRTGILDGPRRMFHVNPKPGRAPPEVLALLRQVLALPRVLALLGVLALPGRGRT